MRIGACYGFGCFFLFTNFQNTNKIMIRPVNDYRIGNLVLDEDDELCVIEQLSSDKMCCFQQVSNIENKSCISTKYPSNIYAIPLTKEWLLKAGFERLFPTGSTYSLRDFNVSDFGENGIYHYDVKQPIKYVHQLQNLYFAMTGEELVFSTEP